MAVSAPSKEDRALAAAEDAFIRHGYARTTMGDIANKAGMSRPALYLLFSDKDAVFSRVIARLDDRKHAEIEAALAGLQGLEAKLSRACLDWGLHGFELAAVHPDAADLFDLRFLAVRQVYARFERLVAGLIAQAPATSDLGATADDVARALVYGMRGLRAGAVDIEGMRRLVTVQVSVFARAITPSATYRRPGPSRGRRSSARRPA